MPELDEILTVVQQWVQKAENDLKNASYSLRMGADCPTDTVCFHTQQCVEKYVKALLVLNGIEFPWTHNLGVLIAHLPQHCQPTLTPEEQERLTDYATTTRYPGDYEAIPLAEAKRAVQIAQRTRRELRKLLPRKVAQNLDPKTRGKG